MPATTEIRASQTSVAVVGARSAANMLASQLQAQVIVTKQTPDVFTTQLQSVVVVTKPPPSVVATQLQAIVVYKIERLEPVIRAWSFSLDGHSFYVLHLGENETLVYDVYSEEWAVWADADLDYWKVILGINWINSGNKPATYGTNVIAGDYATNSLYIFDPDYIYDDIGVATSNTFSRVATTFLPTRANSRIPVYSIDVFGSLGYTASDMTVTLTYADNNGETYVNAGALTVPTNNPNFRLEWRGLGSFSRPGRIFKIIDSGALQRLDGVDVNSGTESQEPN